MSPPVSGCSMAVPGASRSPRCHRARSSCQRCQRPWRGTALGCTGIFCQSVIPRGQWPWHPTRPRAVPSLHHLHPQGSKVRASGGTRVPACTLVSLPLPQALFCPGSSSSRAGAQPGGPLWGWAGGALLGQGSGAGTQGSWVPQESRHRPWMLPMDLVPCPGRAEVGSAVLPGCRGVFAAQLPPVALQTLPCLSLPSCHPRHFLTA